MEAANAQIVNALRPFDRPVGGVKVEVLWRSTLDEVVTFEVSAWAGDTPSKALAQAVRALGRRVIVSRGWADLSLPVGNEPDCLAIGEVNQQALFKRVAAVVHHGGAGTTTAATLTGAPQVVIPQMYDQHYWAQRIDTLGIGTAHAPGAPTADSLTSALEHTLQPGVTARAHSIATAVRTDGAQIAAQHLITANA